jgi:hypothetical protein
MSVQSKSKVSPIQYSQDNPRDQVRIIVGAIEGYMLNQEDGMGDPKKRAKKCIELCRQAQEILKAMEPGSF